MKLLLLASLICFSSAFAMNKYGQLTPEDQKYYQNDSNQGKNQFERIDSLVAEVNKLHGEIASQKAEIQQLKKDIEEVKKGK